LGLSVDFCSSIVFGYLSIFSSAGFWYTLISFHPSFFVIRRFFLVSVNFSDSSVAFYPYVDSANDAVLAVRGLGDRKVQPACLMVASTCCQRSW
jgi:hypothetical protein